MSTTATRDDIPDTFEGRGGGLRFYGIANGQIKTRASKEAPWEYSEKIHGIFDRVGEHSSEWNGKQMPKFEVDLLMKDGTKASISTNADSAVSTVMFASRILKISKGQVIGITTAKSKDKIANGAHLTFVNVLLWDPMGSKWIEVTPEEIAGDNSAAKLPLVLQKIRSHPAYAPRPTRDKAEAGDSERALFDQTVTGKGWPSLAAAGPVYLEMMQKVAKQNGSNVPNALDEVSDDLWTAFRQLCGERKDMPAKLESAAMKTGAEEYDPFADE